MGDEEVFAEEDLAGGVEADAGQKIGFLPAFVIKILKWVAMALAAVIFIVTVVIITMNIVNRGTQAQTLPAPSEEYSSKEDPLAWYAGIEEIRTSTADESPATVMINIKIGYEQGDQKVQTELIARTSPIQAAVRYYFSQKTVAELSARHEPEIIREVKELINKMMRDGQIKEVIIMEKQVFEGL
jgi:flagellar protein FliL